MKIVLLVVLTSVMISCQKDDNLLVSKTDNDIVTSRNLKSSMEKNSIIRNYLDSRYKKKHFPYKSKVGATIDSYHAGMFHTWPNSTIKFKIRNRSNNTLKLRMNLYNSENGGYWRNESYIYIGPGEVKSLIPELSNFRPGDELLQFDVVNNNNTISLFNWSFEYK